MTHPEPHASHPPAPPVPEPDGPATPADEPSAEKPLKKDKKKGKKHKDGIGSQRGVETMFRTSYQSHLNLSSMADNKANIMISINGIMISVVIASISPKIDSNPWLLVPTGVLLLGCAISMVYAILAARPRVTHRSVSLEDVESNRSNILFFGNFVGMPEEEFVSGLRSLLENTDRLYTNMMRDIYGLGQVLQRKYTLLRTSYTAFMVALILSVLLFLGVYLGVVGGVGAGSVLP